MLDRVSITGADDDTNIDDLIGLSEKYPFVEWAILVSPSREGTSRYPTQEWRTTFEQKVQNTTVRRALHLCGQAVKDFKTGALSKFKSYDYQRIQLNFNAKSTPWRKPKELDALIHYSSTAQCFKGPQHIIVQSNTNNQFVLAAFSERVGKNLHILYDASGGHGELMGDPQPQYESLYTGYAGGINPDNCLAVYKACHEVNTTPFWMDMESGVRTDEKLDLTKVEHVLKQLSTNIS